MIKKQFTIYLQNRPGVLAKLVGRLGKAGINIEGISACTSPDVGLVQLVVSNATSARRIFKSMGLAYTTQDVSLMKLPNKPGILARIASDLAEADVNISYIYGTGNEGDEDSYLILSAPDLKKVEAAWRRLA